MPAGWLICSNRWQPLSMPPAVRSCKCSRFGAAGDEAECEPVCREEMAYEVGADGLAGLSARPLMRRRPRSIPATLTTLTRYWRLGGPVTEEHLPCSAAPSS